MSHVDHVAVKDSAKLGHPHQVLIRDELSKEFPGPSPVLSDCLALRHGCYAPGTC